MTTRTIPRFRYRAAAGASALAAVLLLVVACASVKSSVGNAPAGGGTGTSADTGAARDAGTNDTAASDATDTAGDAAVKQTAVCGLLPQSDVAAILQDTGGIGSGDGATTLSFYKATPQPNDAAIRPTAQCQFEIADGTGGEATFQIQATSARYFTEDCAGLKPLSGIGDQACFDGGEDYVKKGKIELSGSVFTTDDNKFINEAMTKMVGHLQ